MGHGPGMGSMDSVILCRNVHIGQHHGQELEPIASYCASPVACNAPGPGPVQCE